MIYSNKKSKYLEYITIECHDCKGTGINQHTKKDKCMWCNGTGKEEVTKYAYEHPEDEVYYKGMMFMEEDALAYLLKEDVLFFNTREYITPDWDKNKRKEGEERKLEICGETIVLFVNCNDTFAWACADAECICEDEIEDLYVFCKMYKFGSDRWVCLKRNEKPQKPLVDMMKKENEWDELMENLLDNQYDIFYKKKYEEELEKNKGCLGSIIKTEENK